MHLANLTWPQIKKLAPELTICIPLGSTEQHGHHLAVSTDSTLVGKLAEAVEKELSDSLILAPTVPLGSSDHHLAFPGTLSISPRHYTEIILDLIRSVRTWGAKRLVFINGHGGNITPVGQALNSLTPEEQKSITVSIVSYWLLAPEVFAGHARMDTPQLSHACEYETSMMQYLAAEKVDMNSFKAAHHPRTGQPLDAGFGFPPAGVMNAESFAQLTTTGHLGAPDLANPEKGRFLFESAVSAMVNYLRDSGK